MWIELHSNLNQFEYNEGYPSIWNTYNNLQVCQKSLPQIFVWFGTFLVKRCSILYPRTPITPFWSQYKLETLSKSPQSSKILGAKLDLTPRALFLSPSIPLNVYSPYSHHHVIRWRAISCIWKIEWVPVQADCILCGWCWGGVYPGLPNEELGAFGNRRGHWYIDRHCLWLDYWLCRGGC